MSAPVLNKVPGPQIDPAAIERTKPLQPAGPPLGGIVLGAALLASLLIHGALLGTVLVAEPRQNPAEQEQAVTVDLVPETAVEPEKPAPPAEAKPEPVPEKKPTPRLELPDFNQMMATHQALQSPAKSAPAPAPAPQPAPSQSQSQPADPSAAKSAPPASQEQPQQQEADKPPVIETGPEDAQAAAARISDTMHLPELAALGALGGTPAETKAKLSAAEIAAFRAEVRKCWTAPVGIPAGQNPKVFVRVAFKADGNFSTEPEVLGGSPNAVAVLQSAKQALTQCQPYRSLPAAKYAEWKLLDLQFTALDVATIASIPAPTTPPKR